MNRRLIFAVLALLCAGAVSAQERTEAPAASSEVRYVGRTQTNGDDVSFDWSGTCFECRFTGGSLAMRVSDTKKNYYNLTVDGRDAGVVTTFGTDSVVVLAEKLGRGEHTVRMQKRTEGEQGRTTIHAFLLDRGRRLPVSYTHLVKCGCSPCSITRWSVVPNGSNAPCREPSSCANTATTATTTGILR